MLSAAVQRDALRVGSKRFRFLAGRGLLRVEGVVAVSLLARVQFLARAHRRFPCFLATDTQIRLNFDPVISASLFTDGCSDAYLANAQHAACFGLAYEDQQHMARVFIAIFFAVFAVETIVRVQASFEG